MYLDTSYQALKTKDKEDISKTPEGKKDPFQKEQRITADFSPEAMQASRQQRKHLTSPERWQGEAQEDAQSHSEQVRGRSESKRSHIG